jgi:hypothetical protein
MSDQRSPTRYRFGPLERRGVIAGWRGGQIASVSVGLAVGVVALRERASLEGALVALVALAASFAVATWPFAGRTVEEWAPEALRHSAHLARRRRWAGSDPFSALRLLDVEAGVDSLGEARNVGVLTDVAARTYVVSLRVSASGFVLAGPEEKCERVAAWAGVLASIGREGSAIHRVQWTCRSVPGVRSRRQGPDATRGIAHPGAQATGQLGPGLSEMKHGVAQETALRSYRALLDEHAVSLQRHEVLLSLSVSETRAARAVKAAGGKAAGACSVLLREAAGLRRRLAEAEIQADSPCSPGELGRFVRGSFEASDESRGRHPATRHDTAPRWPWPMATRCEWGRAQLDGAWAATYWVSEWPRVEVGADFLGPLLLLAGVAVSASVIMEPIAPSQAARKIEQARTSDIADAELRRRGGFLATARRTREEEMLAQREVELADGHAPFRFSGYVTVIAADPGSLEDGCARMEQAAARCSLELRLCYGDQLNAFTATLPVCRGLA